VTILHRALDSLRWLAPVQHWTLAVTALFFVSTVLWIILVLSGATTIAKSPNEVVISFYEAAQAGEYDAAYDFLSDGAQLEVDRLPEGGWVELLDGLTRGRSAVGFQWLGIRNFGDNAVVGGMQDFADEDFELRVELMVRQGSRWRIEWPIATRQWTETVELFEPQFGRRASTD
jgi:hypothetical protein